MALGQSETVEKRIQIRVEGIGIKDTATAITELSEASKTIDTTHLAKMTAEIQTLVKSVNTKADFKLFSTNLSSLILTIGSIPKDLTGLNNLAWSLPPLVSSLEQVSSTKFSISSLVDELNKLLVIAEQDFTRLTNLATKLTDFANSLSGISLPTINLAGLASGIERIANASLLPMDKVRDAGIIISDFASTISGVSISATLGDSIKSIASGLYSLANASTKDFSSISTKIVPELTALKTAILNLNNINVNLSGMTVPIAELGTALQTLVGAPSRITNLNKSLSSLQTTIAGIPKGGLDLKIDPKTISDLTVMEQKMASIANSMAIISKFKFRKMGFVDSTGQGLVKDGDVKRVNQFAGGIHDTNRALHFFRTLLHTLGFMVFMSMIREAIDDFIELRSRILLTASTIYEYSESLVGLFKASEEVRASVGALSKLFNKFYITLKPFGATVQQTTAFTKALAQSIKLSGSNTAEQKAFYVQFGQAMQSGVLRGREFRSMLESNLYMTRLLANELAGGDLGRLKEMAFKGQLDTLTVTNAVLKNTSKINKDFERVGITLSDMFTLMGNKLISIMMKWDVVIGQSKAFANVLGWVRDNLDGILVAFTTFLTGSILKTLLRYQLLFKAIKLSAFFGIAMFLHKMYKNSELFRKSVKDWTEKIKNWWSEFIKSGSPVAEFFDKLIKKAKEFYQVAQNIDWDVAFLSMELGIKRLIVQIKNFIEYLKTMFSLIQDFGTKLGTLISGLGWKDFLLQLGEMPKKISQEDYQEFVSGSLSNIQNTIDVMADWQKKYAKSLELEANALQEISEMENEFDTRLKKRNELQTEYNSKMVELKSLQEKIGSSPIGMFDERSRYLPKIGKIKKELIKLKYEIDELSSVSIGDIVVDVSQAKSTRDSVIKNAEDEIHKSLSAYTKSVFTVYENLRHDTYNKIIDLVRTFDEGDAKRYEAIMKLSPRGRFSDKWNNTGTANIKSNFQYVMILLEQYHRVINEIGGIGSIPEKVQKQIDDDMLYLMRQVGTSSTYLEPAKNQVQTALESFRDDLVNGFISAWEDMSNANSTAFDEFDADFKSKVSQLLIDYKKKAEEIAQGISSTNKSMKDKVEKETLFTGLFTKYADATLIQTDLTWTPELTIKPSKVLAQDWIESDAFKKGLETPKQYLGIYLRNQVEEYLDYLSELDKLKTKELEILAKITVLDEPAPKLPDDSLIVKDMQRIEDQLNKMDITLGYHNVSIQDYYDKLKKIVAMPSMEGDADAMNMLKTVTAVAKVSGTTIDEVIRKMKTALTDESQVLKTLTQLVASGANLEILDEFYGKISDINDITKNTAIYDEMRKTFPTLFDGATESAEEFNKKLIDVYNLLAYIKQQEMGEAGKFKEGMLQGFQDLYNEYSNIIGQIQGLTSQIFNNFADEANRYFLGLTNDWRSFAQNTLKMISDTTFKMMLFGQNGLLQKLDLIKPKMNINEVVQSGASSLAGTMGEVSLAGASASPALLAVASSAWGASTALSALSVSAGASATAQGITGGENVLGSLFRLPNTAQFGSNVEEGEPTWIGERGRELFVPNTSGHVYSNPTSESKSSSGSVDLTVVNVKSESELVSFMNSPRGRKAVVNIMSSEMKRAKM